MSADLTVPLTEEEMCTCEALKEYLIELELLTADSNGIVYENEWNNQIEQVLGQMDVELNGMDISQNDNIIKYVFILLFKFLKKLSSIYIYKISRNVKNDLI